MPTNSPFVLGQPIVTRDFFTLEVKKLHAECKKLQAIRPIAWSNILHLKMWSAYPCWSATPTTSCHCTKTRYIQISATNNVTDAGIIINDKLISPLISQLVAKAWVRAHPTLKCFCVKTQKIYLCLRMHSMSTLDCC